MRTSLVTMRKRLDALLGQPMAEQDLVEITAIFNNVSYIFLYLEANDTLIDYQELLPHRTDFFKNDALDQQLLDRMQAVAFDDPEVELAREDFIEQIEAKHRETYDWAEEEIEAHKQAAKDEVAALGRDQKELLEKICKGDISHRPSVIYYRLISRMEDSTRRDKLGKLWNRLTDQRGERIAPHVDAMINVRHKVAALRGDRSPLAETLNRCRVHEDDIEAFLHRTLAKAVEAHGDVVADIQRVVGPCDDPMNSFGYYMRRKFVGDATPLFDLSACVEFIFKVGKAVFGVDYHLSPDSTDQVLKVDVFDCDQQVGRINFDLWVMHGKDLGANHTLLVRNRGQWGHIEQLPEAYVACRFVPTKDRPSQINFQNVHSLYHEFGHAMNHLLLRERIPSKSGLEYLPIERLEFLSMWAEKWVYHPAFGQSLGLSNAALAGLQQSQVVKITEYRRTFVERAVISVMDFALHRYPGVTLSQHFDALDRAFGVGQHVRLSELVGYFTWPMYIANPGGNFTYLWGAAHSCEVFEHFMPHDLNRIAGMPHLADQLASCFDFALPSHIPDIESLYAFYAERPGKPAQTPDLVAV
ncbi:M3 family metallopeptidase [uncultured Tateyamaria sp.]|uniref:M3 family metallopeptidase n=1 Tax=Tateyamaria sp. 1078 TaxID=3417464 RepID=UPI00262D7BA8|nr:M3 family metallopeptidase [uncultured Tateyamaria sp.]